MTNKEVKMSKTIKNIILVTISNVFTVLAGVLVGFIIPKVLGVLDYGYYKTFTLYISYIGFFSLGIVDGIVLLYGNKDYDELSETKFRSYFLWYLIANSFFTLIIILFSIIFLEGDYKIIFILYAIDIIASNVTGYFQQISQITQRFKEYSLRNLIKSVLTSISVLFIFLVYKLNWFSLDYKVYVYVTLGINYILTFWYVFSYKKFVFGHHDSLKATFKEVITLIIKGFPLLFANLCSTLILTMDKQFVNVLFDTITYAKYAFAYNILTLVTVATSAVSSVLYPKLMRSDKKDLKRNYDNYVALIMIFVFFCINMYYPLCIFINYFLPDYSESLIILRIIFPGIAISACVTVIMHNYYKTIGQNFKFFYKSFITLMVSFIFNLCAYYIFESTIAISASSILVLFLWYFYIEHYLKLTLNVKILKNIWYLIINTIIFYLISGISNYYLAFGIQLVAYFLLTIVFFKKKIVNYIKSKKKV